jgi:hypothetical protein
LEYKVMIKNYLSKLFILNIYKAKKNEAK